MSDTMALRLAPDVAAASGGDQEAFGRLVDATASTVTSITLAILRDVDLSRDVAQEVYLLAWRDLRKLRDPSSFLPWLRQITRNRSHQALRTRTRRDRREERREDGLLEAAADPRAGALDRIMAEEERVAVAEAIASLPPSAREVVVLYYREGRSAAQVAELLDLSEEAVRQRLSRARRRLRDTLAHVVQATRPGPGFTASVLLATASLAMPATASAAVVGSAKAGTMGSVLPGLAGAGAFSALAGLAAGWSGVFFGTRDLLRRARDDEERRGVIGVGVLCAGVTLLFLIGILIRPTPAVATAGFAVMMSGFAIAHFVWLPRVTARRHEAERLEDPAGFAADDRRRRLHAKVGFAVGTLLGGGAVAASWFL